MKEFNEQNTVEFAGLHAFDDEIEKSKAIENAKTHLEKLARITKHPSRLVVHVKVTDHGGAKDKRKKFFVHSKLFVLGKFLEATHIEWDFLSALQKSLKALEKEVIKKYKE